MKKTAYILLLSLLICGTGSESLAQSRSLQKNKAENKHYGKISRTQVVYKTPKTKVVSVRTLPKKTVIVHKGINYYYDNHSYYVFTGGRYIVTTPKAGFRIKVLPGGYRTIHHQGKNYYYFNGVFYSKIRNEYIVVEPVIGTILLDLPKKYEKVILDDKVYFEFSGILYAGINYKGKRAYEVIGIIN